MRITLHVIGKIKETYWKQAIDEYVKRLSSYCELSIIEYPDFPSKEGASEKEESEVKEKEGAKILAHLKNGERLIALDLGHPQRDSVEFASYLQEQLELGGARLHFVIGGSLGLSDSLKKRADGFLTLGKMTFPHQLARVMLLEQLYRAFRILHHEPYHK